MRVALLALLIAGADDLDDAMREATRQGGAAGRATMERWIASHPGAESTERARYWEAQSWARESNVVEADRALAEIELAGGALRWDAALLRGQLQLGRGDWAVAADRFEALHAPPGSRWEYEARTGLERARWGAHRQHVLWVLVAALLTFAGFRSFSARRALWPPPEEAVWSAPVLVVLALAAAPRVSEERIAVWSVAGAGLTLLWIHGAYLRGRTLSAGRRVGEALGALVQAAATLYCAVVASGLWDAVSNTFASGVE